MGPDHDKKTLVCLYFKMNPSVVNKDKFHRKLLKTTKLSGKVTNIEHRRTFTRLKLRLSCLLLEKWQYENLKRNDRSCLLCEEGIEDLEHFIFRCRKLTDKRKCFLEHIYTHRRGTLVLKSFTFQFRKIFTLDFKDKAIVPILSKGLS